MLRARRPPHRRGLPPRRRLPRLVLPLLVAIWLVPFAALFPIGGSAAAPGAAQAPSLQTRLDRLNNQADQAVEQYLQAQLALKRTQAQRQALAKQVADAQTRLDALKAQVSAQAVDAYKRGPGTDVASILEAGAPDDAAQRVVILNLLAQRNGDLFTLVRLAQQAYQQRERALGSLEEQQGALVAQLGRKRSQIERLVADTKRLLAQAQAAERARRAAQRRAVLADQSAPVNPTPPPPPVTGSGSGAAAVRFALAQVGKPYCWGGSGPSCYDCSGLTMMAWLHGGVSLPHSAAAQFGVGRHVSRSELAPGDLIYYNGLGHVAMYIGSNQQVAATHTGSDVKIQTVGSSGGIDGYTRPNG